MTTRKTKTSLPAPVKTTTLATIADAAPIPLNAETIRRYLCEKATNDEIDMFINQCVMFGLNPFKREIHLVKYGTKPATFVVGYESYLKRAERSAKWAGMESGTKGNVPDMIAWVKIYRKDWASPLYHEVHYSEYVQFKDEWVELPDGKRKRTGEKSITKFWNEKPRTMLKKVAIAQGMRMAFPDDLGGMPYTSDEIPVDYAKLATAEIVTEPSRPAEKPTAKTLPDVKDEFTGDVTTPESDMDDENAGLFGQPDPEFLTEKQMVAIVDAGTALKMINPKLPSETIMTGIFGSVKKQFKRDVAELSVLTPEMAEYVLTYLERWKSHLEADAKKAA